MLALYFMRRSLSLDFPCLYLESELGVEKCFKRFIMVQLSCSERGKQMMAHYHNSVNKRW